MTVDRNEGPNSSAVKPRRQIGDAGSQLAGLSIISRQLSETHEAENLPARQVCPTTGQAATGLPAEAATLVEAYQRASKADATARAYRATLRYFRPGAAATVSDPCRRPLRPWDQAMVVGEMLMG